MAASICINVLRQRVPEFGLGNSISFPFIFVYIRFFANCSFHQYCFPIGYVVFLTCYCTTKTLVEKQGNVAMSGKLSSHVYCARIRVDKIDVQLLKNDFKKLLLEIKKKVFFVSFMVFFASAKSWKVFLLSNLKGFFFIF
jgi:hypothetical protein